MKILSYAMVQVKMDVLAKLQEPVILQLVIAAAIQDTKAPLVGITTDKNVMIIACAQLYEAMKFYDLFLKLQKYYVVQLVIMDLQVKK